MVTQPNDGLLYLQQFPKLWKWMNRCGNCQRLGYKPDFPKTMGISRAPQNIRRYFPELRLDDRGLCEQCAGSAG